MQIKEDSELARAEDARGSAAEAPAAYMPKGINVTDADIGRLVVYRTAPNFDPEQGIITSFNDKYVFVRYGNSIRGVATNPDDLDWAWRASACALCGSNGGHEKNCPENACRVAESFSDYRGGA